MNKEQLQQVLDALECLYQDIDRDEWDGVALELFKQAIAILNAAIAQPVQPTATDILLNEHLQKNHCQ